MAILLFYHSVGVIYEPFDTVLYVQYSFPPTILETSAKCETLQVSYTPIMYCGQILPKF